MAKSRDAGSGHGEQTDKISIVLVEDHTVLRAGMRSILGTQADFEVVGDVGSCAEGLELARRVRPDLVISDIDLPDRTGLTLVPDLVDVDKNIRVIMLTSQCTRELVQSALDAGASGYVRKDARPSELFEGIRAVMRGERFLSANVLSITML